MMIISNHELVYLKVPADICEYMKIPRRAASCTCCARYHLQVRADSGKIDLGISEYRVSDKMDPAIMENLPSIEDIENRIKL